MLDDLAPRLPIEPRPAPKEYVGWQYKHTHQNKRLSKQREAKVINKLERRTIKEIGGLLEGCPEKRILMYT